MELNCFSCHGSASFIDRVGFRAECPHCMADLHCCKNCDHYDPTSYNECREPTAEVQREKDRANYCDYFVPNQGGQTGKAAPSKKDLQAAAEALFKKKI